MGKLDDWCSMPQQQNTQEPASVVTGDMDYVLSRKAVPVCVCVFTFIMCLGVQRSESGHCGLRKARGVTPCLGKQEYDILKSAKNATECCKEKGGWIYDSEHTPGHWECIVCQEVMVEHTWLPPPPCERSDCDHTPQQYVWFALPLKNRRVHCIGRSFRDVSHCKTNATLCSDHEAATEPVYCFRHRHKQCNTTSSGCPASSLDPYLARDKKECCVTRRGAAYAEHINAGWYIDEAKLFTCKPCDGNPAADTTWSEWSVCSPEDSCTRKRSLQIPYLEKMPKYWCMETIAMEETAKVESLQEELAEEHVIERDSPVTLALAIVGILTTFLLAGVVCFICIRKRLQARAPTPPTRCQLSLSNSVQEDYLTPISNSYCPTPEMRSCSAKQEESDEDMYESVDYDSTTGCKPHMPLTSTASNVTYIEMK